MAPPQAQLPSWKWAEVGTPFSDAAGLFLAAQDAAARRRQAQQALDEQNRHALETEAYNRRVAGLAEISHSDSIKQQALQNELERQNRNKATVKETTALAEIDPAQAAAIAASQGGSLTPQDTASKVPEVAIPPGADPISMLLAKAPGAMTKAELRTATGEAKDAAKAQYPGANLMKMSTPEQQQPGMEPTNIEESLMLAAIGKNRTPEQDNVVNASRRRQEAVEAAKAADVGKFSLTLPGAQEPMSLFAGAARQSGIRIESEARDRASDQIGAMGDSIIASLGQGASPTELEQLKLYAGDFKFVEGLVRGGAIPADKLQGATAELNFLMTERGNMAEAEFRAKAMAAVARIRGPAAHPGGSIMPDLSTHRLALQAETGGVDRFNQTVAPYGVNKDTGKVVGIRSQVDQVQRMWDKYESSGHSSEARLGLGTAFGDLKNAMLRLNSVGTQTDEDINRVVQGMTGFLATIDSYIAKANDGTLGPDEARSLLTAGHNVVAVGTEKMQQAAQEAYARFDSLKGDRALGKEGVDEYVRQYNSTFGTVPGVRRLKTEDVTAPGIFDTYSRIPAKGGGTAPTAPAAPSQRPRPGDISKRYGL